MGPFPGIKRGVTTRDGRTLYHPTDVAYYAESELEQLGRGIHRVGYDMGAYVLKLAHHDGNFANEVEAVNWVNVRKHSASSRFARVVAADVRKFSWLVMEKVDILSGHDNSVALARPDELGHLEDKFRRAMRHLYEWDLHLSNIGTNRKGFLVAADYGMAYLDRGWDSREYKPLETASL